MDQTLYFVFNAARHPTTRLLRTIAPGRASHVQWILGGTRRLVGNGFAKITREQLDTYWDDLKWKCRTGQLMIRVNGPRGPIFSFNDPEIEKVEEQTSESVNEETAVEIAIEEEITVDDLPELLVETVIEDPQPAETPVPEPTESPIPDMKSSRAEIVEYVTKHFGKNEVELEGLTKRQILAMVQP